MRRRGQVAFLWILAAAPAALAQSAGGDVSASVEPGAPIAPPAQQVTYGALPGGLHVPSAETLPKGVAEISMLSGFGWRSGLLADNHRFGRAIGDLAFAYGITDMASVGLSLDGRYDKHFGLPKSGDDGYVGDPHLYLRAAKPIGTLRVGGQLGVWVPGKDAPSIAASAISVDARLLLSLAAGPGLLSLAAGFRYDNSAKSIDMPSHLSLQDRVSLGVSNFNAALVGAELEIPSGKLWYALEASAEVYIGDPRTNESASLPAESLKDGKVLARVGASVGFHVNDVWSVVAYVEGTKVPGITAMQVMTNAVPLVPYEPTITGGLGLQARFGGAHTGALIVDRDCHKTNTCKDAAVPLSADFDGTVVDSANKPVVGAKVTLTLESSSVAPQVTDANGKYHFTGVRIGKTVGGKDTLEETGVEVTVEVSNMKPGKASLAQVAPGPNAFPQIQLEPVLPPGQLRVIVRAVPGGRLISGATVTVAPGDANADSGADGIATIDLPPGQYKITVKAAGYAPQQLDATVDPNGVAIKNAELHR